MDRRWEVVGRWVGEWGVGGDVVVDASEICGQVLPFDGNEIMKGVHSRPKLFLAMWRVFATDPCPWRRLTLQQKPTHEANSRKPVLKTRDAGLVRAHGIGSRTRCVCQDRSLANVPLCHDSHQDGSFARQPSSPIHSVHCS